MNRPKRQRRCAQCGADNPPHCFRFCSPRCAKRYHNALRPKNPARRHGGPRLAARRSTTCACGNRKHPASEMCRPCRHLLRGQRPYKPQAALWRNPAVQDFVIDLATRGETRARIAELLTEEFAVSATKNMVVGWLDRRGFSTYSGPTTHDRLAALLALDGGGTRTPEEIAIERALAEPAGGRWVEERVSGHITKREEAFRRAGGLQNGPTASS